MSGNSNAVQIISLARSYSGNMNGYFKGSNFILDIIYTNYKKGNTEQFKVKDLSKRANLIRITVL